MSTSTKHLLPHLQRLCAAGSYQADRPDAALLEQFACARDQEAFTVLLARHGPMVLRLCRRVLGEEHAAQDAFQATFLVLARKASSVRQPDALAAWLYGVASRIAHKARGVRHRWGTLPAGDEAPADPRPDPLAALTARELLDAVEEEVGRLPVAYRLPVVLCCLEGRTREEAAALLGWTEGSVKGRLERGRARLQDRLARRGLSLSAALASSEVVRSRECRRC